MGARVGRMALLGAKYPIARPTKLAPLRHSVEQDARWQELGPPQGASHRIGRKPVRAGEPACDIDAANDAGRTLPCASITFARRNIRKGAGLSPTALLSSKLNTKTAGSDLRLPTPP